MFKPDKHETKDAYVQFEQAMSLAKQNLETAQSLLRIAAEQWPHKSPEDQAV